MITFIILLILNRYAYIVSHIVTEKPHPGSVNNRIVTRYMGSGIKGQKKGGIRDHSPGIWDQKARDRDHRCFSLDQGSGVLDQQNFAG